MPIDARIPLGVQPPQMPNPMETMGQIMQMRNLAQRGRYYKSLADEKEEERKRLEMQRQQTTERYELLADTLERHTNESGQTDHDQVYRDLVERGAPDLAQTYQKTSAELQKMAQEADRSQLQTELDQLDLVSRMTGPILNAEDSQKPIVYQNTLRELKRMGIPTENLPDRWDPSLQPELKAMHLRGLDAKQLLESQLEKTPSITDQYEIISRTMGTAGGPKEWASRRKVLEGRARRGTLDEDLLAFVPDEYSTDAVQAMNNLGLKASERKEEGVAGGKEEFKMIRDLNADWRKASENVREMAEQSQKMRTGLEQFKKGDKAAGAQAVLVTFQKILDPTSVVRESEYARSAAGQDLLAQIQGAYERLVEGGAGVPAEELEKFVRVAQQMVNRSTEGYIQSEKGRIRGVAKRFRLPEELIFEDTRYLEEAARPIGGEAAAPESDPLELF